MGFTMCTITFGACAIWYDTLSTEYPRLFQFLYYTSTFFGQVSAFVTFCVNLQEMLIVAILAVEC